MKDYLAGLEDAPLPDDLRVRVAAARRRRLAARLGVAASCSVAVAAFAFALVQPEGMLRQETLSPGLAVEAPADVSPAAIVDEKEIYRSVQAIDRALQVAYDRQATDEEVAPLWEARQDLMLAAAAVRKNG
ncbi:hypothetical protein [Luteimonas sp. A478]